MEELWEIKPYATEADSYYSDKPLSLLWQGDIQNRTLCEAVLVMGTYCPKHYEVVKTWSLRSSNVEKLLQASHLKQLNRYLQNKVIKDLRARVTSFKKGNSKLIVCWPVEFGGPPTSHF